MTQYSVVQLCRMHLIFLDFKNFKYIVRPSLPASLTKTFTAYLKDISAQKFILDSNLLIGQDPGLQNNVQILVTLIQTARYCSSHTFRPFEGIFMQKSLIKNSLFLCTICVIMLQFNFIVILNTIQCTRKNHKIMWKNWILLSFLSNCSTKQKKLIPNKARRNK